MTSDEALFVRFWTKVEFGVSCWLWTAAVDLRGGYGKFGVDDHIYKAHRVAWQLTYGPIPDAKWVLHRCDVPACVNPGHLFLGDHLTNMADMVAKGRQHDHGRTHCRNGHPLVSENVYFWKTNCYCRACGRKNTRDSMRRVREASRRPQ